MKTIFKYLLRTVGIFIFIFILSKIDLSKIKIIIANINILFLLLSIFFALILTLVKTQRWSYINRCQNINIPLFSVVRISTIASFLGMVTPGRLGELIKIRSIRKYSPDLLKRWNGVLIDRLHDIIILLFAGLASVFFISHIELNFSYMYAILFICVILFLFFYKYWKLCIFWITRRILPTEIYLSYRNKYRVLSNIFLKTFKKSFLISFFSSVLSFLIQCIVTLMIVYSLGETIPFYIIVIIVSVSAFASLLPITIGGLGTREGVYIYLLSLNGIPIETGLVIAFIDGVLIFTFFFGLLAFLFWATNRFSVEF